jgi:predicted Fe-Mo cluster-binding NifX family protein
MKVAVTACEPSLDAMVDEEFGHCQHVLVVETETFEFESVDNRPGAGGRCAGATVAELMQKHAADVAIIGHCGPGALAGLQSAGVAVYDGTGHPVREAVTLLKSGSLKQVLQPSCDHAASRGCCGGV